MRLLRAIAVGMCAVPLAFANDGPRSPVVEQSGAPRQLGARGPHEGPAITAEEWSEIEAWMKINCPNRIGFVERMADGQGQKDHAKLLMAEQYRQIKRTNYKPLQDALVQQAQAQDLIFGAQVKLREAHRGTLQHEVATKNSLTPR